MSTYKPTDNDGLKQDGTPDKRVGTGEFAHGKVDPHEAGVEGGKTSGSGGSSGSSGSSGDQYKPTDNDGLKQDGTPDKRVGTGEFAHGKVDPHEAGAMGGSTS